MAAKRESQRNEPYEEPPRDEIPGISRMHVQAMEAGIDEAWSGAGMHQLMLRTVGRKSGNEHKVALPYWVDDDGHKIVVASFAGAQHHPHWYLNLADKSANPEVLVRTRDGSMWAEADVLDGDEYDRIWDELTTDREFYREYQTRTDRRIPLVRLLERRPA
jgi:deazaflavin-dependent oxidoreductase (nitroreductase family)